MIESKEESFRIVAKVRAIKNTFTAETPGGNLREATQSNGTNLAAFATYLFE